MFSFKRKRVAPATTTTTASKRNVSSCFTCGHVFTATTPAQLDLAHTLHYRTCK